LNSKISTFIKIVVSVGLIIYLFSLVDLSQLGQYLVEADYLYLIFALVLYMLAMVANAVKWHILLEAQGVEVPLVAVIKYTFVGFFFNNFLPATVGGDLMRGYGLAKYTSRNTDSAVSVIVDRIIGLMAFMGTAVISAIVAVSLLGKSELKLVQTIAIITLVGLVVGFAMIVSQRLRTLFGRIFEIQVLRPLAPFYERISDAFGAYRHAYGALLNAFVAGLVTVILTGFVDIAIVHGLHGTVEPIYIFLLNPIIAFVLLAPVSIGGIGVGQAAYIYFYGLVGMTTELALALSIVKQAIVYLGSLPGGGFWVMRDKTPE